MNHRSRATWEGNERKLIKATDKLGIDQLCYSTLTPRKPAITDGFRECNKWTTEALLVLMDSRKIDKAVVSSASSITYRNAQADNEDVAVEVCGHSDRLISIAVN